jgi:hypothetical protein
MKEITESGFSSSRDSTASYLDIISKHVASFNKRDGLLNRTHAVGPNYF